MMEMKDRAQIEQESLLELTGVGASHAASALSAILSREFLASAPLLREGSDYRRDGRWRTAVIFEADGELSGLVAILLSAPIRESVANRLLTEKDRSDREGALASALREIGNIVASHTISTIADTLGSRILLSVPLLIMEEAGHAFSSLLDQRGATQCIESELSDSARILKVRLLFVPLSKNEDEATPI
jgi:chemotaxis protein CheY-P-specific phosphatase CheC